MAVLKNEKFCLEFPMNATVTILYNLISTSNGLQEWFADKVDEDGSLFTFHWDESQDEATLLEKVEDKFVRFQWDYQGPGEYFELAIDKSPVTNQIVLKVTDFADQFDIESQKQLLETQINDLKHRLGI